MLICCQDVSKISQFFIVLICKIFAFEFLRPKSSFKFTNRHKNSNTSESKCIFDAKIELKLFGLPSVGSRQLWDNGCHNFMICLGEVVVEVILARHHLTDYWNLMRPFLFHILYYLSFRVSPTPLLFIFTPTLQRLLALFYPAFRTTFPKVLIFGAKIQIDQNQCVSTTQKIRILRFNSNF